ncbi:hypothetical protein [Janthinobacterium sp. HLS12-2]|uniref:hypothetical protein n=1 Tax=Janthinobacterium sp. HLS12-2 TaxID=1259324 RepID=UPI003F280F29
MKAVFRAAGMLALMALGACSEEWHPLDRHLAQLRPDAVAALPDMAWPAGTLLCPLTMYQSQLPSSEPLAESVNAFLAQKQFVGDEGHWSLIVVKPAPAGNDSIEQLTFKRNGFDVINEPSMLKLDAVTVPKGFALKTCVPLERARVLVTRLQRTDRTLIIFGTV